MLTTRTGSCATLSCPPTPNVHHRHQEHHHHQQQHRHHLQVKKLFETWPVKGRKVFALEAPEVEAEVACCDEHDGGGGGGGFVGVGRRRRLQTPMSDVCPYPLQGNFAIASSTAGPPATLTDAGGSDDGTGGGGVVVVQGAGGHHRLPHHQLDNNGGRAAPAVEAEAQVVDRRLEPVLDPSAAIATRCARHTMDNCYSLDLERIVNTVNKLDVCGWYFGRLSWQQATDLLKTRPVGTFLLRDSSDPLFLFALSVQTERGPTSVRIHYGDGQFKLDAETNLFGAMPLFDCVVQLVDYYVQLSQSDKAKAHVWLDDSGRRDLPVRLVRPLYCRVPQLQHLSRLAINQSAMAAAAAAAFRARHPTHPLQRLAATDLLPKSLLSYIREYPYQR